MKTHLLASLLLLAAPLLACDSSAASACPPTPTPQDPIASTATHHGKTPPLALPAQNRHAALPPAPSVPAKSVPAPSVPAKAARPGHLFM